MAVIKACRLPQDLLSYNIIRANKIPSNRKWHLTKVVYTKQYRGAHNHLMEMQEKVMITYSWQDMQ